MLFCKLSFLSFFVHGFFSHFFISTYLCLAYKCLFTNYTLVNAFLALRPKNAPFPKYALKKCLLHPLSMWSSRIEGPGLDMLETLKDTQDSSKGEKSF